MSKHDLQALPIYQHTRDSIEAHLSIVFAAMAVSHNIETQTGWSIKKFVRTTRCYRTLRIKAGRRHVEPVDQSVQVRADSKRRDVGGNVIQQILYRRPAIDFRDLIDSCAPQGRLAD